MAATEMAPVVSSWNWCETINVIIMIWTCIIFFVQLDKNDSKFKDLLKLLEFFSVLWECLNFFLFPTKTRKPMGGKIGHKQSTLNWKKNSLTLTATKRERVCLPEVSLWANIMRKCVNWLVCIAWPLLLVIFWGRVSQHTTIDHVCSFSYLLREQNFMLFGATHGGVLSSMMQKAENWEQKLF